MRLTEKEVETIKSVVQKYISDAKIVLFGSRVYDNKRGGDIDLLVVSNQNVGLNEKIKILAEFELNGIERKVDLIFKTPNTEEKGIIRTAIEEGITL